MRRSTIDNKVIRTVLLITGMMCLSTMAPATRISDYDQIRHWEYTYFQSMITYVSPLNDYIITAKRKVHLVEVQHKGETLNTSIKDLHGTDLSPDTLKEGQWVYVWGGVLSDHSIGAKNIILLPGELTNTELAEHNIFQANKKFVYGPSPY